MNDPRSLSPTQEKLYWTVFVIGAVVLICGGYLKFFGHGNTGLVTVLIAGGIALFAFSLLLLIYRVFRPTVAAPASEIKAAAVSMPVGPTKVEAHTQPIPVPQPGVSIAPKTAASVDLTIAGDVTVETLMNSTFGQLLLASHLKDPEGAGRIVAQAISQAAPPGPLPKTTSETALRPAV